MLRIQLPLAIPVVNDISGLTSPQSNRVHPSPLELGYAHIFRRIVFCVCFHLIPNPSPKGEGSKFSNLKVF